MAGNLVLQVKELEGSFTKTFVCSRVLGVRLPRGATLGLRVESGEGVLLIGCFSRDAVRLPPRIALRLVDQGFRIPFLDPGGAVALDVLGAVTEESKPGAEQTRSGDLSEEDLWAARVLSQPGADLLQPMSYGDQVYHLVQDKGVIDSITEDELPPDEYYVELGEWLRKQFPLADPALVEHAVPLVAAFDTGTAFALSFGIAKFQLAQSKVKLVGEIVGREGRSPNPEAVSYTHLTLPTICSV